jgi:hypothetical protein
MLLIIPIVFIVAVIVMAVLSGRRGSQADEQTQGPRGDSGVETQGKIGL